MPDYSITAPDGTKYTFKNVPAGTPEAEIQAEAERLHGAGDAGEEMPATGAPKESWLKFFKQGIGEGFMGFLESGAQSEPGASGARPEQIEHLPGQPPAQTLGGRIAQGFGAGLGNPAGYALGPAGVLPLAGRVGASMLGGAGSEIGGMLTGDSAGGRIIGGLVGGAALPTAMKAVPGTTRLRGEPGPAVGGGAVPPPTAGAAEHQTALAALRRAGIEPTAGDVLRSPITQRMERMGNRLGGGASYEIAKTHVAEQFTRAVGRSIGVEEPYLTDTVWQRFAARNGAQYKRAADQINIRFEAYNHDGNRGVGPAGARKSLGDALQEIPQEMAQYHDPEEDIQRVSGLIYGILDGFVTRMQRGKPVGRMDGATYQNLTRYGESRLARAMEDPRISYQAMKIRTILDDAMEDTAQQAIQRAQAAFRRPPGAPVPRGQAGAPARERAIRLAEGLEDLKEARRQFYASIVLKAAVSRAGPMSARYLVTPEALAGRLRNTADAKLQYAMPRAGQNLAVLARAGEAVLTSQQSSIPELGAMHGSFGAAGGLAGMVVGHPYAGAAAGAAVGPGLAGRLANSRAAQWYLKNQALIDVLNQTVTVREAAARGAAVSQPNARRRRPLQVTVHPDESRYGGPDE
jgi:hypothetical protein